MLTTISLVAAAVLATAAGTTQPSTVTSRSILAAQSADSGAWRAVHSDTVSDLIITTEAADGRVRFTARGAKGTAPVTTSDFAPDSVANWLASADQLAAAEKPAMGEVRSLGGSLALTVTQTVKGESALGFYVADAMSDQTVALALTRPQVAKLTTALRAAVAAAKG